MLHENRTGCSNSSSLNTCKLKCLKLAGVSFFTTFSSYHQITCLIKSCIVGVRLSPAEKIRWTLSIKMISVQSNSLPRFKGRGTWWCEWHWHKCFLRRYHLSVDKNWKFDSFLWSYHGVLVLFGTAKIKIQNIWLYFCEWVPSRVPLWLMYSEEF